MYVWTPLCFTIFTSHRGLFREKVTSTCFCSKMAYTLSLVAKLGATVIFNRISRADVNISLEELFRSNIEDRGNDVKLVKVKVGEERGGHFEAVTLYYSTKGFLVLQLHADSVVVKVTHSVLKVWTTKTDFRHFLDLTWNVMVHVLYKLAACFGIFTSGLWWFL